LIFRVLTGFGLGGEYAAINSAIDELIPSKRRGVVDLAINGTWWLGTIMGSLGTIVLLNPHVVNQHYGWRIAFGMGAILAIGVFFIRKNVPESPRWLLTHGQPDDAKNVVEEIETHVKDELHTELPPTADRHIKIDTAHRATIGMSVNAMANTYRGRTLVALTLMGTQAFIYNAFTFTQGLVLGKFFYVPDDAIPAFYLPFAAGNLVGPLLLGRFFDTVGRKKMIAGTYMLSGTLLLVTGGLFALGKLNAVTITVCWTVVFFFASAGSSAAYLTASEIFPLEARALAIAIVYAAGTLIGGAIAPSIFGVLIATNDPLRVCYGYAATALLMVAGGAVEARWGVSAENKNLEDIAQPLSSS
jgi:MFS family permease